MEHCGTLIAQNVGSVFSYPAARLLGPSQGTKSDASDSRSQLPELFRMHGSPEFQTHFTSSAIAGAAATLGRVEADLARGLDRAAAAASRGRGGGHELLAAAEAAAHGVEIGVVQSGLTSRIGRAHDGLLVLAEAVEIGLVL